MIEPDEVKSLSSWRLDLQRYGKKQWLVFYQTFLALPVSNIPRFYKALNLYGDWAMFESIVACSDADINGDPLNYVLAVTKSKWKEQQQDADEEVQYLAEVEAAKKASQARNDELAKKLKGKKK